jgi:hypothetical protein
MVKRKQVQVQQVMSPFFHQYLYALPHHPSTHHCDHQSRQRSKRRLPYNNNTINIIISTTRSTSINCYGCPMVNEGGYNP